MNEAVKEVLDTVVVGRFSLPEGYQSKWYYEANERLRAAGVVTYAVELTDGGVPLLELGETTYVGQEEIVDAVERLERHS